METQLRKKRKVFLLKRKKTLKADNCKGRFHQQRPAAEGKTRKNQVD